MQGAEAERADDESPEPVLREGALEPEGRGFSSGPEREEEDDGLFAQAAERELDDEGGRAVEPLDVVHCDDDRSFARERPDRAEEREGDRAVIRRRPGRVVEQERNLERAALRCRQGCQHVREHRPEQVGERREREPRLCRRRDRGEHPQVPLPGQFQPRPPEDRLADAGLSFQQARGRSPIYGVEEPPQLRELIFAADDLSGHQRRLSSLARRKASGRRGLRRPSTRGLPGPAR